MWSDLSVHYSLGLGTSWLCMQIPNIRPLFRLIRILVRLNMSMKHRWDDTDCTTEVEFSWNVMAHGDAREGKWRGNCRMDWVANTLHTTSEHGVSSITTIIPLLPLMLLPRLPVVDWTDAPADLNGFVRFAERINLVSARVPSHFKHSLLGERSGPVLLCPSQLAKNWATTRAGPSPWNAGN